MTIPQTVSEEPVEGAKKICEGEVIGLDLTTSQEARFLSSGSEGRGIEMNDYSEDKLRSLDESRLAELAIMSTTDVEDLLGARVPLPDTSLGGPERTGSQSIGEELHERASGGAETSTAVKSHVPIYSK